MKRNILCFILLLLACSAHAQAPKNSLLYDLVNQKRQIVHVTDTIALFSQFDLPVSPKVRENLEELAILKLDKETSRQSYIAHAASITVIIPFNDRHIQLELIQQDINPGDDFSFGTIHEGGKRKPESNDQGLHYRGYISGDPASLACISIFKNGDVMGIFCSKDGNFNIGKNSGPGDEYILYNSRDMKVPPTFECATAESLPPEIAGETIPGLTIAAIPPAVLCKKVRIYWEADYGLYSNNFNFNLTNTRNYLVGLFNQVSTMYQNEGIIIELTDSYVWVTADPYPATSSSAALTAFKSRWNGMGNNFKADLAVLIAGGPSNNGGVAYLLTNNLCSRNYAYGYANVYGSYNTIPAFSWDVEVVTHEMGHMMGSHHTHWCGWNTGAGGTCGAIDDCYTTENAGTCTSCAASTSTNPTAPFGFKGSVMSYCHLRSGIGIDLANGFGPLPQAAIRNTVSNSSCTLSDNKWTGAVSTAWENPANWGCGTIPDATTDVSISSGLPRYPVVSSAAICRRIIQEFNSAVRVKTGFTLMIAGPPANP